jgi:hypothetical protein
VQAASEPNKEKNNKRMAARCETANTRPSNEPVAAVAVISLRRPGMP